MVYGRLALFLKLITICSPTSALIIGPTGENTPQVFKSFLGIQKCERTESELTKNPQMLLVRPPFLLNCKGVISVFPVHRLLITRADFFSPFFHKHVAWTRRHVTNQIY